MFLNPPRLVFSVFGSTDVHTFPTLLTKLSRAGTYLGPTLSSRTAFRTQMGSHSSLLCSHSYLVTWKKTQSWEADKPHNLEEIMYLAGVELSGDTRLWSHSVLSLPTGS